MKLRELQAALAAATDAAAAIDAAVPAGVLMTAEQSAQFDEHIAKVAELKAEIARKEQLDAAQRLAATPGVAIGVDHTSERPWGSLAEQLQAVRRAATSHGATVDPRLYAALGANETVDAEGGFLIAPEFAPNLWQRTYEAGNLLRRCFRQPMSSNRLVINAVDEDSRVDGSRWAASSPTT